MDPVPRRPAKRSPRPKADPAKNMIDALAAVAFEDIPEFLMPSDDDVEALLDALMLGVLDDYLDHIAAIVKIRLRHDRRRHQPRRPEPLEPR